MPREAPHRKRHLIFNNDGDDVLYHARTPTKEAHLPVRTSPLPGSQVDSLFYSNSLCLGDAMIGGYGPVFRPKFKLDHPAYLCGSKGRNPLMARGRPWTTPIPR